MRARDVMKTDVLTVTPDTRVGDIAKLLTEHGISAVPVLDQSRRLVGIVSEGDLLHRAEMGTERRRSRWLELFVQDWQLAAEYLQSHGRTAEEIMERHVVTVEPETPVATIVETMEKHGIKRVPVVEHERVVGIVTRGDLVRALATVAGANPPAPSDTAIRDMLIAEIKRQAWTLKAEKNVTVQGGIVHLWGETATLEESRALISLAKQIPGVVTVLDHMRLPSIAPLG